MWARVAKEEVVSDCQDKMGAEKPSPKETSRNEEQTWPSRVHIDGVAYAPAPDGWSGPVSVTIDGVAFVPTSRES